MKIAVVSCPLCGSEKCEIYKEMKDAEILSCHDCGMIFVGSVDSENASQYLDNQSSPVDYYRLSEAYDRKTFTERIAMLEKYCPPGTVLDVGCNCGTFLKVALARGWEAVGVEPNALAAEAAKSSGAMVLNTFFDSNTALYPDHFDAAYLGDVIEHVVDPRSETPRV
ncbi:MAG: class I SAM-dependent methyltransferase [Actinobacteria bacterium]|nr:class I SAM-dependent methyltransferase [Actinomycetota bacterium]